MCRDRESARLRVWVSEARREANPSVGSRLKRNYLLLLDPLETGENL